MSNDDASSNELASNTATTVMQFLNMAAFLASPRVVEGVRELPSREHLLVHADRFIAELPSLDGAGIRSHSDVLRHARALRDLIAEWTPDSMSSRVPAAVQERARALLQAFGVPEPPGGWDDWEASANDEKPAVQAVEGPEQSVLPGKNQSVYFSALRVNVSGAFLGSLAEGEAWRAPAEEVEDENRATLASLKEGAERFFSYALKGARCLDLLSPFLSPHTASRAHRIPARDELLDHLAAYIDFSTRLKHNRGCKRSERIIASAVHAERLDALFRQWTPGADVPADVVRAVRDLFEALDIREPPQGWERFEGFAPMPGGP
jgi:hypothetical protein